jgi:hypothetical protein
MPLISLQYGVISVSPPIHYFGNFYLLSAFPASKIIVGLSVAIPAASLCINHRLYCIAAVRSVMRTKAEVILMLLYNIIQC